MKIGTLVSRVNFNREACIAHKNTNICFWSKDTEKFDLYQKALENRDKILLKDLEKNRFSFIDSLICLFKSKESKEQFIKNQYYKTYGQHKWTNSELSMIEGLQAGLNSFDGMNMKQIYFLLKLIDRKMLWMPVVRGCYHNCAHCYLDAKAPVKRMQYEDFHNFLSDISQMKSRLFYRSDDDFYISNNNYGALFHDSDGSEIYVYDKNGVKHEFPELAFEVKNFLGKKLLFDTAGWNPKSKETQERMERLVAHYVKNPERFFNDIDNIYLSINPFHSIRVKALEQKQKGNIENYEQLNNIYLDMVANMLNSFAPLISQSKLSFICRAFPSNMKSPELSGYRIKDMDNLEQDIIKRFVQKYPETIKKYHNIEKHIRNKMLLGMSAHIMPTARNNFLKSMHASRDRVISESVSYEYLKNYCDSFYCAAYVDLNGDFYFMTDYNSFKCPNIKINFAKPETKPIMPKQFPKTYNI